MSSITFKIPLNCYSVIRTSSARYGSYSKRFGLFLKNISGRTTGIECQCRTVSFWGYSRPDDWSKAVTDAEKIVGYPTSFMSLRCLLSDEFSNVAMHMRKLVGTKHPLMKTARGLVYDGTNNLQTRGLIVLLMSKAAGVAPEKANKLTDKELINGILPSQRSLAEITEMIHSANLIHKGVVNLSEVKLTDGSLSDMELGNKMAVLSGDFLLANASTGLAQLQNTKVVEMISSCIGDLVSSEFTQLTDKNGIPHLHKSLCFNDWIHQTFLSSGSLLAKSCQSALELAGHNQQSQLTAFYFGQNMALAQQLSEDLKPFIHPEDHIEQLTITSAPVIKFILSQDSLFDIAQFTQYTNNNKIVEMIKKSSVIAECKEICENYGQKAIDNLDLFPHSEAKTGLIKIVQAVTDI